MRFTLTSSGSDWKEDNSISNISRANFQERIEEVINFSLNRKSKFGSFGEIETMWLTLGYRNEGLNNLDIIKSSCANIKIIKEKNNISTQLTVEMTEDRCRYLLK